MHNHTFRLQDVAGIIESATGKTIADGDLDGKYDAVPVVLMDHDFTTLESTFPANTIYFGDLVLHSYDASAVAIRINVNSVRMLDINQSSSLLPIGNIFPCVMFDEIVATDGCFISFYGWKITLNS